ncbi:tripartite tricarboxylate transporter TctB family protein [Paenibacillus sp. IB182496]|uniref:Tripartite tricarboxylate transporter TctB family protein n=1 Tax=Paenibacillus sabuli TaxID=2772509 RepID=A0A927BVS1_9BACL|nr:tripartite tricarboxylate transporter TctB family protein [Paenibacillus sabuli]MBD2846650.1 tripartite tricarboxylate transporter TctB family protein [Paenibacillus sabuli]
MLNRYGDIIFSGALAVIAIIYLGLSFNIPQNSAMPYGSDLLPKLAGAGLLVACIAVLIGATKRLVTGASKSAPAASPAAGVEGEEAESAAPPSDYRKVLYTFMLILLYVALWETIGFLIMTAIYLFFQFIVLSDRSERRYVVFAVTSIITTAAVYYVFVQVLSLTIPGGLLG